MKMYTVLRKIFALFCVLPLLALASCGDIAETDTPKANGGDTVTIRIAVADQARTAFPHLTANDFSQYKLTCDGTTLGVWTKDSDKNRTAYEVMNGDELTVSAGEHTFVLTGTEQNGASYAGTITKTVTSDTVLNFTLELSSVSPSGAGWISLTVNYPKENVRKIVVTRYKSADVATYKTAQVAYTRTTTDITGTYNYNDTGSTTAVGEYIVEFVFCGGDDIPLGTWLEYVYVSDGFTAKSSFTIPSFDDIYSISYDEESTTDATFTTKPLFYTWQSDITLPVPTKTGLTFAGWYEALDEDGNGVGEKLTAIKGSERAKNITLYATWKVATFTVRFDLTGAEGSVDSQTVEYQKTAAAPDKPTRTGYIFADWYTTEEFIEKYDFDTPVTQDVTLYARWTYTVTFDANAESATGSMENVIRYKDDTSGLTLAKNAFACTDNTFLGWATEKDAVAATYGDEGVVPATVFAAGNTTLYAVWHSDLAETHVVTFAASGGEGIPALVVEDNTKVAKPDTPLREGYAFLGWYTSSDGGTTLSDTEYDFNHRVTQDLTLYAAWKQSGWYVSASGADTNEGTPEKPFATVAQALSAIQAAQPGDDCEIVVIGEVKELVSIGTGLTTDMAKTLTIRGRTGNDTDILNGDESGTVLTLTTAVPITLADITITGGSTSTSYTGAGITLNNSNALLTLADGAIVTGNKNTYSSSSMGGGVFVYNGTLTMEDGAEISANTSYYGGGVMLYSNCTVIMDGGKISNNTSVNYGGGVYMAGGTFTMNGGEISDNVSTGSAGGVYVFGTFTMNGGKIAGNKASSYAGGVYIRSTTFTLNDGEISGNTAGDSGGGIWNEWGNLYLYGGVVSGNTASTGNGGAVRVEGYVCMKGNISIPAGDNGKNDVCFASNSYYIYVTGELTAEAPVATITPNGYSNKKLLCASNGVTMDEDLVAKFALTPEYGVDWHLEIDGNDAWLSAGTYNITYKDVGGEFSGVLADDSPTKHKYSVVTTLKDPTKDGYTFIGWFIGWYEKDGEILTEGSALTSLAAKAYTDDITLYAKWAKQTSSVEIGSKDIAITLDTTAHTLTASDGYKNYIWLVDEEVVADSDTLFTVSADGKTLTYSNDDLLAGCVYTVKVSACDENGVQYQATKTVTRQ